MKIGTIDILPVEYGKSVLPESWIFQGGAADRVRPIVFKIYLLISGERRILVDAGCETMPGFVMWDFIGPVSALEKLGFAPEDITDVIITHAHHDHIQCVGRFPLAAVYMQRDVYAAGKEYLTDEAAVHLFDEELTVVDGVKAVKVGGHAKGSCVVEVTGGQNRAVIAGDECYLRECIEKGIPTGSSCCLEQSRAFLKKYGQGDYTVLLCHDA